MFFSDADYPGKDISDVVYVSISEKDDKPVHVYIADNSKGQRAVQAYIGTLNVKYPGKVNITWTTLDVIASRYQDSERRSDSNSSQHLNSNQERLLATWRKQTTREVPICTSHLVGTVPSSLMSKHACMGNWKFWMSSRVKKGWNCWVLPILE